METGAYNSHFEQALRDRNQKVARKRSELSFNRRAASCPPLNSEEHAYVMRLREAEKERDMAMLRGGHTFPVPSRSLHTPAIIKQRKQKSNKTAWYLSQVRSIVNLSNVRI